VREPDVDRETAGVLAEVVGDGILRRIGAGRRWKGEVGETVVLGWGEQSERVVAPTPGRPHLGAGVEHHRFDASALKASCGGESRLAAPDDDGAPRHRSCSFVRVMATERPPSATARHQRIRPSPTSRRVHLDPLRPGLDRATGASLDRPVVRQRDETRARSEHTGDLGERRAERVEHLDRVDRDDAVDGIVRDVEPVSRGPVDRDTTLLDRLAIPACRRLDHHLRRIHGVDRRDAPGEKLDADAGTDPDRDHPVR
jgi:hypothetical protein